MNRFLVILSLIGVLLLGVYVWLCVRPLPNDEEIQNALEQAHNARVSEGSDEDCGESLCSVCHPLTWRFNVRRLVHNYAE